MQVAMPALRALWERCPRLAEIDASGQHFTNVGDLEASWIRGLLDVLVTDPTFAALRVFLVAGQQLDRHLYGMRNLVAYLPYRTY